MTSTLFIVSPLTKEIIPYLYSPHHTFQPIISDLQEKGRPSSLIYYDGLENVVIEADRKISSYFPLRKSQIVILTYWRPFFLPLLKVPQGSILMLILTSDLKQLIPYYASPQDRVEQISSNLIKYQGDIIEEVSNINVGKLLPLRTEQILLVGDKNLEGNIPLTAEDDFEEDEFVEGELPRAKFQTKVPSLFGQDVLTINEVMLKSELMIDKLLKDHNFENEDNKLKKWEKVIEILRDHGRISERDFIYLDNNLSLDLLFNTSDSELAQDATKYNIPVTDRVTIAKTIFDIELLGCAVKDIEDKGYWVRKILGGGVRKGRWPSIEFLSNPYLGAPTVWLCNDGKCQYILKIASPLEIQISVKADDLGIGAKIYETNSCKHGNLEMSYFIMEKIDGFTLEDHIQSPNEINYSTLIPAILDKYEKLITDGNILYYDLNLNNIIVSTTGQVFIIDYGLAEFLSAESNVMIKILSTTALTLRALSQYLTDEIAERFKDDKLKGTQQFISMIETINNWWYEHYPDACIDERLLNQIDYQDIWQYVTLCNEEADFHLPIIPYWSSEVFDMSLLELWLEDHPWMLRRRLD